jgi:virulence factor Mce-like protein
MAQSQPDSQAFQEGNRLAKKGDLPGAEQAYAKADEEGHGTAAAYAGLFAESRGELDEARAAYERADERGDGFGAFRLGLVLSRAGDWDAAREAWDRAEERGQEKPPFDYMGLLGIGGTAFEPASEGTRSAFANPVLIGAVTVLVLIVGVFLAYNANTGLPFVPTRELRVEFANGAALTQGSQVTSTGGFRIGLVSEMHPIRLPSGVVGAEAILKLDRSFGQVPANSTASISPRNLFGQKYVDLERGTSSQTIPDGGVLPARQTTIPVQFDDINRLFDAKTRPAVDANLVGFGNTLADRGSSLNDTFAALPDLLGHLTPVARYLSDPSTELTRLFSSLNGFFSTISPVAEVNLRLFADQATTFEGLSRDPAALQDTIRQSPPTLDVGTDSLAAQQPFLVDLKTFADNLNPASLALRQALPNIDPALEAGIQVLPRTPPVNVKLQAVLAALKSLAQDPTTNMAVNGLSQTVHILNPVIKYLGPFVTVCNNFNQTWTQFGDLVSEATNYGTAQRALLNSGNHQTNSVGQAGATAPANGYQPGDPPAASDAEYYHGPNYWGAINPDGTADCEGGQTGFPMKLNHLDPQGRAFQSDPHLPGSQGTTWSGRLRVPAGETFSREPTTGPQLPKIPSNP